MRVTIIIMIIIEYHKDGNEFTLASYHYTIRFYYCVKPGVLWVIIATCTHYYHTLIWLKVHALLPVVPALVWQTLIDCSIAYQVSKTCLCYYVAMVYFDESYSIANYMYNNGQVRFR